MPRCQNEECSKTNLKPEELLEENKTGILFCGDCSAGRTVIEPQTERGLVLGRKLDYGLSYTRKEGLRANARLGGASLSLHVDQEEISSILGPEEG